VNLRGFAPSDAPVTPVEALCGFFDALQVPNEHIPASIEGQASLYRSVLAGKRMLVVLDNAGGSEQVRPLLPGRPGCLVLVTSRSRLTGLVAVDGALSVMLDELGENEARELLERRLGLDRVAAEPDAASDIVRLCARLPMALSIVAARAAVRPCLRLTALASELGDRRTRLDAIDTEEAAISLRAAFSWSFDQLNTSTARMFRLLGARSAPDISVPAAASLAGMPMHLARAALDQLACVGLVSERVGGRYVFHELLRDYAAEQAAAQNTRPGPRPRPTSIS
jgi:hypothetical protein